MQRLLTFRAACVGSILAHVLFLVGLNWLLGAFEPSEDQSPPLVFDYVFAPAQSYETSELTDFEAKDTKAPLQEKRAQPVPESEPQTQSPSAFVEPESPRKYRSNPQVGESANQLANQPDESNAETLDGVSSEALSEPRFVPEQSQPQEIAQPYALSAIQPTSLDFPRNRATESRIVSAKVAMTHKQHKMLRKRLKKWTENLHRMELPDSSIVWEHKGKRYSAAVRTVAPRTETDIEQVIIEVSTEENGYTLSSQMRMKRLAFSSFAQFVDYWDPRVAVHNDVLNGRFHTNTTFNVSQTYGIKPEFNGKVTTASYEVKAAGTFPFLDKKSIFVAGIETGVREINLPKKSLPFAHDSTVSEGQIRMFDQETWITFQRAGSFSWRTASNPERSGRQLLQTDKSFYIVGPKKEKLHLRGVLDGRVLVYSPGKIVIDGSLTYARHPEFSVGADDYLGIVSDKDVEVAHPRVTGSGNLHMYASIYAKRRFKVSHLHGKGEAMLYIYGGLTAGSLTATEPRYSTHIQFDKRLEARRPPGFPMTDRYEVTHWDGIWEVKGRDTSQNP